jgi:hypothetical protein
MTAAVPEIIDPAFAKISPKRLFSMTDYESFGLVFSPSNAEPEESTATVDERAKSR